MLLLPSHQTRNSQRQRLLRSGFTLIEVMVVIVILGILAAVIVPNVIGRAHDARVAAAKQDVATLAQALAMYKLDNARIPTAEQGLKALVEMPTLAPLPNNWRKGGYVPRLPNDPWGNPYQYANPGLRGEADVFSFGADGKAGGEGENADLGTWNL
ncbi:MAG: type II secretion system protein GspG [Betaproteobacteria bacterium]|nr:MAG: type II secretion system protein GspG [Betaproteobacteria bacterium]TAG50163.1 MAG: type II secretion system protein GspG [Betaproteobacteria bacterium]